jgi:hypothetical protein
MLFTSTTVGTLTLMDALPEICEPSVAVAVTTTDPELIAVSRPVEEIVASAA